MFFKSFQTDADKISLELSPAAALIIRNLYHLLQYKTHSQALKLEIKSLDEKAKALDSKIGAYSEYLRGTSQLFETMTREPVTVTAKKPVKEAEIALKTWIDPRIKDQEKLSALKIKIEQAEKGLEHLNSLG